MDFPILVESENGTWSATLLGAPSISVAGTTRADVVTEMEKKLLERMAKGEIFFLHLEPPQGLMSLVGKYADDPTLNDIVEEAYQLRDQDVAEAVE